MSQQKATGWKVPLLFCAVMGVAVLGTWLWRNLDKPEVPPLEPGLVAAAQTYHIDLDARDCATLPWGAFAAKAMKDPGVQTDAHFLLNARWRECPRP